MSLPQAKPEATLNENEENDVPAETMASDDAKNQWKATTVLAALVLVDPCVTYYRV
jgi:hypothetical protein